jgi:hypothetical protein
MNTEGMSVASLSEEELAEIAEHRDRIVVVWLSGEALVDNKIVNDTANYMNSTGLSSDLSPAGRLSAMLTKEGVGHVVLRCRQYPSMVIFRLLNELGGWRNVFAVSNVGAEPQECRESSVAGILARRTHAR